MTTVLLVIAAGAVIAAFIIAVRRPQPVLLDHDEPTELDEMLRPAEDRDWTREALAVVREPGDPLARELSEIELAEALLFDEVAAAYAVRLDWAPPSFTQSWEALGELAAHLGDTQVLEAIPA